MRAGASLVVGVLEEEGDVDAEGGEGVGVECGGRMEGVEELYWAVI